MPSPVAQPPRRRTICVVAAHPYPSLSRANRALLDAVRGLAAVEVRSLYELYPDFDIDVTAERRALERACLVVWLHPMYWYSVPALLKHWFDKVLALGWAYGEGGGALQGKHCLWVTTTGSDAQAYGPAGAHAVPFEQFIVPLERTAIFCGMQWEAPLVIHGARSISDAELADHVRQFVLRLTPWTVAATAAGNEGETS